MLNKGKHILPDLKDHEVEPPSFLFEQIKQKIEEEENMAFKKLLAPLAGHSVSPAEELFAKGIEPEIQPLGDHTLKALKDYKVAPPVQFEKMFSGIKESAPKAKVFSLKNYARSIAAAVAVIILGGAAYFLYQNNHYKADTNNPVAVSTTPENKPGPTGHDTITVAPQPAIPSATQQGSKTIIASAHPAGTGKKSVLTSPFYTPKPAVSAFSIDGSAYPVNDKDYLAAFASFNEASMPAFLRADKPVATAITIDRYTSINISEGMAAILKKTYKTRRNGKPTRRARKQREKIEKWKQADADYFNQNSTNNPLDPIDLGDFILYK